MNLPDIETVDEQLTAYLDGELSPADAATLEKSLVDDERLRLRLAELRKSYDLLDEIPETPHNQRFTKSTLELVIRDLSGTESIANRREVKAPSRPIDWWGWPGILGLLGALAIVGSLTACTISFVNARRDVRNLGLFADVRGLEDVHELKTAIKLSEATEIIAILRDNLGEKLVPPPPDTVWDRKTWVQSLTPMQISRLESGRELTKKLDRDTLTRYQAMESQIEIRPDRKQIQETIHLIGLVLDSIPSYKRLEMDLMKSDQRYEFLKEQLYRKAAVFYAAHIPTSDKAALEKWDATTFHPALVLAVIPDRQTILPDRQMLTKELLGRLLFRRIELEDQESLISELASTLTPTAKKLIEGFNKDEQIKVLNTWLFPNKDTPLDVYAKLGEDRPEYRELLDLGDPQRARQRLESNNGGPSRRGPRTP